MALETADWDSCFTSDDVDMVCSMWTNMFLHIAQTYIPNRNVLIRPKDSPWYSCELRRMNRKLVRLYKKAKQKKTDYHWSKYKLFNKIYHECLDKAETTITNVCVIH